MVFFAPVTTPYVLLNFKRRNGFTLFMAFLTTFCAVVAIEVILYAKFREENKYSHLPPVTRQMLWLSDDVKKSTIALDRALIKLENLSKVESRIHEIKETIRFIGELREIMVENQTTIQSLIKFTADYSDYFKKKDLEWVFRLQEFYNNRNVVLHYKSLVRYLDGFEALLRYTYTNFYKITDDKSKEALNNYDEYYLRYRRAVDSHNKFNVKRIDYQNRFLQEYPQVKSYLPGERQTDTFRLWG